MTKNKSPEYSKKRRKKLISWTQTKYNAFSRPPISPQIYTKNLNHFQRPQTVKRPRTVKILVLGTKILGCVYKRKRARKCDKESVLPFRDAARIVPPRAISSNFRHFCLISSTIRRRLRWRTRWSAFTWPRSCCRAASRRSRTEDSKTSRRRSAATGNSAPSTQSRVSESRAPCVV